MIFSDILLPTLGHAVWNFRRKEKSPKRELVNSCLFGGFAVFIVWNDSLSSDMPYSSRGVKGRRSWNTLCSSSVLASGLWVLVDNFSSQRWRHRPCAWWQDCVECEQWWVVAHRWDEALTRSRQQFSCWGQRVGVARRPPCGSRM